MTVSITALLLLFLPPLKCAGSPRGCSYTSGTVGAKLPPCGEGISFASGTTCTPLCEEGYVPSVDVLLCSDGRMEPPTFHCEPLPCTKPLPFGHMTLRCTPRLNATHIASGGVCVVECMQGYSPLVPTLRCAGGQFRPSAASCESSPCAVPSGIKHTSGIENIHERPCQERPMLGANRVDETLLFTSMGSDTQFRNTWAGWYAPGFYETAGGAHMEDGKRSAYDEVKLVGLRFVDSLGAFAHYKLLPRFEQKSLLDIVQDCMKWSPKVNTGNSDWILGHCQAGVLQNSSDIVDVGSHLRIGVGADSGEPHDWALFMLRGHNAFRFERHDVYAVGSTEEANTGLRGRIWIYGIQEAGIGFIPHGGRCTTRCDGLYVPSVESLECRHGALDPPRFQCLAESCRALTVAHAFEPSCLEGPIILHGNLCTPRCENPLYLPSGAAKLECRFGTFHPPLFTCLHACDGTASGLTVFARREHPFGRRAYSGPSLFGTGLELGPASLGDRSKAAAEWNAGLAPERWRFSSYGSHGPPTASSRSLARDLAAGFGCRICQQLINTLWYEVTEPGSQASLRWLSEGCGSLVPRALLKTGWHLTTANCRGAGLQSGVVDGIWCFIKDPSSEVALRPNLADEYNPTRDAMFQACEQTLDANAPRIAAFLDWQRNGTPSRQESATWPTGRNEHLSQMACTQAACCNNGFERVQKKAMTA